MSYKLISGVEIPDEWSAYSTQQNAEFEIIHRPVWDTQTFTSASTLSLNFFQTPQANVGLGNEVFPLKNSYLCASIGLYFKTQMGSDNTPAAGTAFASRANDVVLITNTGVLAVTIGNKEYGPFPLYKLIPGCGIWGFAAGATTGSPSLDYAQLGAPDPRAMFKLAIPLVIPQNTRTVMTMSWAATVASAITSTSLTLILDGKEARPLQ